MKKVNLIPYQKQWPALFASLSKKIKDAIQDEFVAIHHIGSTSVPGLASKDKIDICLQVRNAKAAITALETIGFEHQNDWNIPFKYGICYRKEINVNLHMFDFDHLAIESNLLFANYLKNNDNARDKYAKLKNNLVTDETSHQKDHPLFYNYTLRKSSFIKSIIKKTGFDREYIQYCTDEQELKAAKELREKYFSQVFKTDPNPDCFVDVDQKHFVLYKGVNIAGYAHIKLKEIEEKIGHINFIIMSENYNNLSLRKHFEKLIDKWLKMHRE